MRPGDLLMLAAIFAIMYFLLIRPQQKKMKEHQQMIENIRRGDQVITQGGIIGKVVKVREDGELEVLKNITHYFVKIDIVTEGGERRFG